MKKIFEYLEKNFVLIVAVMFFTAILDLTSLTAGTHDFGLGWVVGFVLIFVGALMSIIKSMKE